MDGDTVIGGPARIGGVIHIAALAGDNFFCDLFDGLHGLPL
jgi:hypothetical protein